ncbi:Cdc6-like AAA superfamily ATPase [Halarchaeum rubridurum]|uniref:Cdc6-like AAA superfamily ATPase n=1 Tax=Halarchaeum rubridurum TaxID=489911 RepID=A0A830FV52_9EURY|nr:AAA family ATPase [Halarchaeum rubridurum]MBP1953604.1 Cdc6-like AAA superfamily ATPase [Halarchaeum rubridurum]GGM63998.1 orc / cell division control protein 6 [Halarchaeum rubridurum]
MITAPHVFEDGHLPRSLEHREGAMTTLAQAFQPATNGDRAEDVLIHGPSGVGKTALARCALRRLDEHADVDSAVVDTMGATAGDILRTILHQHHAGVHLAGNEPLPDLVEILQVAADRPCIVVLDEADDLHETNILDHLRGIGLVSVVVIVHDPDEWLARAPDGYDHAAMTHLGLDRYGTTELADILEARARVGLRFGAVTSDQLHTIADEVAGVARDGIQSLRAAAELAQERDHPHIHDLDVADCYARARTAIRRSNLASLPTHHQVLYAVLYQFGDEWVRGGRLHDRYERADDRLYSGLPVQPISRRDRRYKIQKLEAYDLVEREGKRRGTEYRVVDRDVEPPLVVTTEPEV